MISRVITLGGVADKQQITKCLNKPNKS
jgi:hypothetical protein